MSARAPLLDGLGRVIDFSVIKTLIGGWLDLHWDHTTIVWDQDTETLKALLSVPRNKEPFVAPFNPTAENMALFLLQEVCPKALRGSDVQVFEVIVWETPNCKAIARLDERGPQ